MDEKSVRKSHGHHIQPAKVMGERALLVLGLLSLLTAADEVRHADAQHRATSDPSEGHAVETGEGKVRALLVLDGEGDGTVINVRLFNKVHVRLADKNGHIVLPLNLVEAIDTVLIYSRDCKGEVGQSVVAVEGVGLLDRVGTSIEALDLDYAAILSFELMLFSERVPFS